MQKHQIYEVFDSKANCYELPFFSQNDDTATRDFHRVINKEGTKYNEYPEDFSLFHAGQWDMDEAQWEVHSAPIHVVNAIKLFEPNLENLEAKHLEELRNEMTFSKIPRKEKKSNV